MAPKPLHAGGQSAGLSGIIRTDDLIDGRF
jgi:hypothetical protein